MRARSGATRCGRGRRSSRVGPEPRRRHRTRTGSQRRMTRPRAGQQHVPAASRSVRASFDDAAALYDRARPGYPNQVFEDLAKSAALRLGSRVLEIGCGTGQAMLPLAERGYRVVAVELGERLAAVARKKLAAFPCVEVAVAAFESWPLPPEPFQAVAAATSSHWLDPEARLPRAAAALRPGGVLATIATHHVAGGTHDFFLEVQPCYERWDPRTPPR